MGFYISSSISIGGIVPELATVVAMSAKQDFGDFSKLLTQPHASCGQFNFIHAGYRAAVNANGVP